MRLTDLWTILNIRFTPGMIECARHHEKESTCDQIARETRGRITLVGPPAQPRRHHAPARLTTPTYSFRSAAKRIRVWATAPDDLGGAC